MIIEEKIPLAPLTTFHIGGPARYFVRVADAEGLQTALDFGRNKALKTFILGGGSNVLFSDAGFDGLVIKIETRGIEEEGGLLIAGAGEEWDALVQYALKCGLWGIENLSGIPGSVGAAPVQNIGAYGAELAQTLEFVEAFDTQTGEVERLSNQACGFGYRTSRFKQEPGRFIVLCVGLRLSASGAPNLAYRDLAEHFGPDARPRLEEVREAVLAIRAKKFPDLAKEGTAGSFFLNPVISTAEAAALAAKYPAMPQFPAEGGIKVSLAWLLDNALGIKGMQRGAVRLFERQPLVIVAERGATAQEVRALASEVARLAQEKLALTIEPEVRIIQ